MIPPNQVLFLMVIMGVTGALQAEGGDEFTLRHEVMIDAPVGEVWNAMTTSQGLKSWMAPLADIDLRVGGKMRANYRPDGSLGDENTIENTILSFEPERMLSIKATRPPAGFPFADAIKDMWSVIYFEPVGIDRTHVSISGMGYGQTPESGKMREFFDKGNAQTLEQLRKKFARTPDGADADPLALLHRMLGGEWIFENQRPDGSLFRGRVVSHAGPDGQSLIFRGWLGGADGMYDHSAMQVWREPGGAVRFQSIDENGAVATGGIVPVAANEISWDWNMRTLDGRKARYRVQMVFQDTDHYQFVLHEIKPDGGSAERVRVNYARVAEAPETFRKLKAGR